MQKKTVLAALTFSIVALLAACSEGSDTSSQDAGSGQRRIEMEATDALRFEPATLEVDVGETVTFVVTNSGATDHEFTVGDDTTAGMFTSDDMASPADDDMGMGHSEAAASVPLPAGETVEMTVTFDEAGEIPVACHLNDHDEAGMTGTIVVT